MALRDLYSDLWSELDTLLIQYPELSEIWLDRATVAATRAKYSDKQELRDFYKRRAFVALVMERLFRIYQFGDEAGESEGGDLIDSITIDNPEFLKMWYEGGLRDEYSDYPEFVQYAEKNFFDNEGAKE